MYASRTASCGSGSGSSARSTAMASARAPKMAVARDVLDDVFPPALRVVVAGRRGQLGDRIGPRPAGPRADAGHGQLMRGRQVAEPDRDARGRARS